MGEGERERERERENAFRGVPFTYFYLKRTGGSANTSLNITATRITLVLTLHCYPPQSRYREDKKANGITVYIQTVK